MNLSSPVINEWQYRVHDNACRIYRSVCDLLPNRNVTAVVDEQTGQAVYSVRLQSGLAIAMHKIVRLHDLEEYTLDTLANWTARRLAAQLAMYPREG